MTGKDEHLLLHDNERDFERLRRKNDSLPNELARDSTFRASHGDTSTADQRSRTIYVPTTTNTKIHPGGDDDGDDDVKQQPLGLSFDSPGVDIAGKMGTGISNLRKTLIKENTELEEL